MKKYGKICCFSGLLRPDRGNTARMGMVKLGSKGLRNIYYLNPYILWKQAELAKSWGKLKTTHVILYILGVKTRMHYFQIGSCK